MPTKPETKLPQGRPPRAGKSSRIRVPLIMTQEESDRLDRLAQIVAPVNNNMQKYNRSETIRIALAELATKHGVK
jgi:hypothetical protein